MADEDLDLDGGEEEAPKSSKKMLIIIIAGVLLLVIVAVLGTLFMTGAFDGESEQTETAQNTDGESSEASETDDAKEESSKNNTELSYWPLEPPFVLNFEGKSKARYMQVGLEVSTTSAKAQAAVKKHMPVIRNEIVLLLSGQKYQEMVTPDGKEQLRAELIETMNNILKQHKVKNGIDNIYFTSFVMQ